MARAGRASARPTAIECRRWSPATRRGSDAAEAMAMNLYVAARRRREAKVEEIKRAYGGWRAEVPPGHQPRRPRWRPSCSVGSRRRTRRSAIPSAARALRPRGRAGRRRGRRSSVRLPGLRFLGRRSRRRRRSTFGELFADVLQATGRARDRRAPSEGADVHATVAVAFEEAMRGGASPRRGDAPRSGARRARGVGRLAGRRRCAACSATAPGRVRSVRGHMVFARACRPCGGAGVVGHRTCAPAAARACGVHTGRDGRFPPACDDGAPARGPGEGHAGRRGGPAGALHVTVEVRPHRVLPPRRRRHLRWRCRWPCTRRRSARASRSRRSTARCGCACRPARSPASAFRLRERGRAAAATAARGDLVVTVRLVLPPVLDERSRELLREFGARNPDTSASVGWSPRPAGVARIARRRARTPTGRRRRPGASAET